MAGQQIPLRINDIVDTYDVSIQKMFIKTAGKVVPEFTKFVNVQTGVTDLLLKESSLSGLGEADFVVPENGIIKGEVPVLGYDKPIHVSKRALAFA